LENPGIKGLMLFRLLLLTHGFSADVKAVPSRLKGLDVKEPSRKPGSNKLKEIVYEK
jgi:hypothetical protein